MSKMYYCERKICHVVRLKGGDNKCPCDVFLVTKQLVHTKYNLYVGI